MTGELLTLLVALFLAVLVFGTALAQWLGPNPLAVDERRHAYPMAELRRFRRHVRAGAVAFLAALFVVVATFPQGGPRP